MKIPFLNIWVTRTGWENVAIKSSLALSKLRNVKSETYIDKQGRLRYQHNGQFAPDDRSKFKRMHDQLRSEVNKPINYDAVKKASKIEEFGR